MFTVFTTMVGWDDTRILQSAAHCHSSHLLFEYVDLNFNYKNIRISICFADMYMHGLVSTCALKMQNARFGVLDDKTSILRSIRFHTKILKAKLSFFSRLFLCAIFDVCPITQFILIFFCFFKWVNNFSIVSVWRIIQWSHKSQAILQLSNSPYTNLSNDLNFENNTFEYVNKIFTFWFNTWSNANTLSHVVEWKENVSSVKKDLIL